jgi:hypothetical protein
MSTFRGQPVYRPQGVAKDAPLTEWQKLAHRAVSQGGRIYQSESGDMHLVSPSGAHWGSFKSRPEMYQGGSLGKFEPEEGSEDITSEFVNGK